MQGCAASSVAADWRSSMVGFTVKIKKDLTVNRIKGFTTTAAGASARVVNVGYPDGPKEEGTSVAMIAAVHNFGVPEKGIPERPFMTQGIAHGRERFNALNRRNIPLVLQGQMTTDQALGQLGAMAVGAIQQEIKNGEFKALKQSTMDEKGSTRPLIDTGQMLQTTTFVIENKK